MNYLALLRSGELSLEDIPEDDRTEEILISAIEQDIEAIQHISDDMWTEDVWIAVLKKDGMMLKHMPEEYRDEAMCMAALQGNGLAIKYVPEEVLTEEMCCLAVKNQGMLLRKLPEKFCTKKVYMATVQQDGQNLQFVPKERRDNDICLGAVKQNGFGLFHVPEDQKTAELCRIAVENTGGTWSEVPNKFRTKELAFIALQTYPILIRDLPPSFLTKEACEMVVKKNAELLKYVPEGLRTKEICLLAIQQDPEMLAYVPNELLLDEFCSLALEKSAAVIKYVPLGLRTPAVCLAAVQLNGELLEFVPDKFRTREICQAAVKNTSLALQYVPEQHKRDIIDTLTAPRLIANNFNSEKYFPMDGNYSEQINEFLANIKYISVIASNQKKEVRDTQLVYMEKPNHKDRTVNIVLGDKKNLDELLLRLGNLNKNDVHLTLIGHGTETSTAVADMNAQEIAAVCKINSRLRYIHLVACHMAVATKPENEKQMIQRFKLKTESKAKTDYGLQTILNASVMDETFQNKCRKFCLTNQLAGVYVLSKDGDGPYTYRLISLKIKENGQLIQKITNIPENNVEALGKLLAGGKPPTFPGKSNQDATILRNKQNSLHINELKKIRALKYKDERFTREHPKYDQDKSNYPFLANIEITASELQESFMQKVAHAIENNTEITQDIAIDAPTKSVHVDVERECLLVSRTHLYTSNYDDNKNIFFGSGKANIHKNKLYRERYEDMKRMQQHDENDTETNAKKVTIKIPGKGA